MNKESKAGKDKLAYLWAGIGTLLILFANGQFTIPIMIWIAPVFLIRFLRSRRKAPGIALAFCISILANTVMFWGTFPIPDVRTTIIVSLVIGIISGIASAIPFIADMLIAPRIKGFLSTLVFPSAAVALFYLNSLRPSVGAMNAPAFTQFGNLPLMQCVSLFGIWGLAFLIFWFSSFINWLWENGFEWEKTRQGIAIYCGLFLFLLTYGGVRLGLFQPDTPTVRTAMITVPEGKSIPSDEFMNTLKEKRCRPLEEYLTMIRDSSNEASKAGAKLVAWQEYSALMMNNDEQQFVKACSELARKESIFLLIPYGVFNAQGPGVNKALFINPSGTIEADYSKRYLVDGGETPFMKEGAGQIPVITTPYGNIAIAICFDISFSRYIRKAAKKNIDIMINPALDWKKITPSNPQGAAFSAVENGYSLVRPAGSGLSLAVDPRGRTISSMNFYTARKNIIYADIPIKGARTLFSIIGDLIPWLSIAGMIACIVIAIRKNDPLS